MRGKLKDVTFKNFVAIAFCAFIFVCGALTIAFNFREIFGGLYSEEYDTVNVKVTPLP